MFCHILNIIYTVQQSTFFNFFLQSTYNAPGVESGWARGLSEKFTPPPTVALLDQRQCPPPRPSPGGWTGGWLRPSLSLSFTPFQVEPQLALFGYVKDMKSTFQQKKQNICRCFLSLRKKTPLYSHSDIFFYKKYQLMNW